MNNLTLVNLIVLWSAMAVFASVVAVVARSLVHKNRRLQRGLEAVARASRAEQAKMIEERRDMRARIDALARNGAALDKKLLTVESRQHHAEQKSGGSRPYELAMQMAGRGAGVEDLVAAGLSRGEAELALRMHGLAVS
jgi:heme exporter protein D